MREERTILHFVKLPLKIEAGIRRVFFSYPILTAGGGRETGLKFDRGLKSTLFLKQVIVYQ